MKNVRLISAKGFESCWIREFCQDREDTRVPKGHECQKGLVLNSYASSRPKHEPHGPLTRPDGSEGRESGTSQVNIQQTKRNWIMALSL